MDLDTALVNFAIPVIATAGVAIVLYRCYQAWTGKSPLKRVSGTRYSASDDFAAAEFDLLGSAEGFLVILNDYRLNDPCKSGAEADKAVIDWLAAKLSELRAFRRFTIAHNGVIVFSRGRS